MEYRIIFRFHRHGIDDIKLEYKISGCAGRQKEKSKQHKNVGFSESDTIGRTDAWETRKLWRIFTHITALYYCSVDGYFPWTVTPAGWDTRQCIHIWQKCSSCTKRSCRWVNTETRSRTIDSIIHPAATLLNISMKFWRLMDAWLATTRLVLTTLGQGRLLQREELHSVPTHGYQVQWSETPGAVSISSTFRVCCHRYTCTIFKNQTGNQFVEIITDRYIKLTGAIPTTKITSTQVAHIFLHESGMPYGILDVIMSYNGQQFLSKFFTSLCSCLGAKKLTATAFNPQTNGQVESYGKKLMTCLRLYIANNQQNW